MEMKSDRKPDFKDSEINEILLDEYDLAGILTVLPAEYDQNFLLDAGDLGKFVVKIANRSRQISELEFKNSVIEELSKTPNPYIFPILTKSKSGEQILKIADNENQEFLLRVLSYLPGEPLNAVLPLTENTLAHVGETLGQVDTALKDFSHPNMQYPFRWDLAQIEWISKHTSSIKDPYRRGIVERALLQFRAKVKRYLDKIPISVIHNDANGDNLLLQPDQQGELHVSGLIDFGDAIQTHTVNELAILCAYAIQGQEDILSSLQIITAGYHQQRKLNEFEIRILLPLIIMRLCTSVLMSAIASHEDPENSHRQTSESSGWDMLEKLQKINWMEAENAVLSSCGFAHRHLPKVGRNNWEFEKLVSAREKSIGYSLSLAYDAPLEIVKGQGQFLFDQNDHAYLDCVNNISHIGHGHPKISEAITKQVSTLNTNTRYLHPLMIEYSERLTATLPDPLSVCFFVNSGSEANELAIRLARIHTDKQDVIVLEDAYHGNAQTLIDLSPYKCEGPGGKGLASWAHKVIKPDPYAGLHRGNNLDVGKAYAEYVKDICQRLEADNTPPALFIVESIQGCGGQIVMPEGYLQAAFEHVRNVGGVTIVDEIQVGMGRVGTHWWAFESQDVVPDIVTIGKPMGNGHPVAAVVTTPEIARSFNNGMEYFNSFGGNPVSMAVAHAVMDVIEEEGLLARAERVGQYLQEGFNALASEHQEIGDVRGLGMFMGVELVEDRETRKPATQLAGKVIEKVLEDRILLSVEGPGHNVLKIKPPLQFSEVDADLLLGSVNRALTILK
ncbi:MAG: aminotransferase class III-fold pyridoxal phosphate-dependent enzyme [Chloroflexi bacterium]|jgi:4-aminobutyrate aminotransferase-like enzyme/Ser/Thr protein kinase RdoA (MazF antagonist)|nr:aminotransferase class III-fold pyridoxal phosphate-dependent enzyme [Chloroflexota bacterium]MBT3668660.1 aminotransferase class III-fold pyridoxal phosphate-dependent enzyme [Chloroflexota bacterium]MBT4305361.1 aminotransferase class III-fold pyridoxal phosphate-dependent enzyme [Chloroflexota bacterium]MBT4532507.1 aminotransferase class III-fold pyridoxal phosphate-dependent enzyme [Chloroflexota bacterium]MBT4683168.1 aminotransferase class III-fold pyridoxal phosphate-dependent enzyme